MRALAFAAALCLAALSSLPGAQAREVAQPALPFTLDLPEGFTVRARPRGPDFDVYDVMKGDKGYVGIYVGGFPSFPIKKGATAEVRSKTVTAGVRDGRVVEYVLAGSDGWTKIHVWVQEGEGVDPAVADRIAASARPK
jgi:hypothetical protein